MSPAIVELGEKLVDLLERDGQHDITVHWMAHYLAELMERARSANDIARAAAQRDAADLILRLWRQRAYLPPRYPLQSFEPVLTTLERLGSSASLWVRGKPPSEEIESDQVRAWMERAQAIDRFARQTIRICLDQAITLAETQEAAWLEQLREASAFNDSASEIIVRIISFAEDEGGDSSAEISPPADLIEAANDVLEALNES